MYTLRQRALPALGKEAEVRALLTDWVQHALMMTAVSAAEAEADSICVSSVSTCCSTVATWSSSCDSKLGIAGASTTLAAVGSASGTTV